MQVDLTLPLVFGLASLLALHLIVVQGELARKAVIGLFAFGLAAGVAALGWWLAPPRYLPSAPTSGLAVAIAEGIRSGLSSQEPVHFLIVDGGSHSARGVSDAMLGDRLADGLGTPVQVLSVTLAGGNQLERWSVLRRAMALLDARERARFESAPKTLLLEIHSQYDRYPLVQLRRNRHSDRAYAYLDSAVFREALRAEHGEMDRQVLFRQWADVVVHAAINVMNVGLAPRVASAGEGQPRTGYAPLDRAVRGYRFPGTKAVRQSVRKPPGPIGDVPWRNVKLRRDRYVQLLGRTPETIYFSVPTPRVADLDYARAFCEGIVDARCLTHGHRGLLARLDHAQLWYDNGHLQRRGAEIYTRWLAGRLVGVMKEEDTQP